MKQKKRIKNEDLLNTMNARFDKVESRLDNLERDVSELKIKVNNIEREATKHGWNLSSNKY